jgi:hypothetical protein
LRLWNGANGLADGVLKDKSQVAGKSHKRTLPREMILPQIARRYLPTSSLTHQPGIISGL